MGNTITSSKIRDSPSPWMKQPIWHMNRNIKTCYKLKMWVKVCCFLPILLPKSQVVNRCMIHACRCCYKIFSIWMAFRLCIILICIHVFQSLIAVDHKHLNILLSLAQDKSQYVKPQSYLNLNVCWWKPSPDAVFLTFPPSTVQCLCYFDQFTSLELQPLLMLLSVESIQTSTERSRHRKLLRW